MVESESSAPVTVTVCAVFQFPLVNVRLPLLSPVRVTAPVSPLVTFTVTSADGCDASATRISSESPSSTVSAEATVKPASASASSSVTVTVTDELPRPL